MGRFRFTTDDAAGLWRKGDTVEHLGRESDHPDAPPLHRFRLERNDDEFVLLSVTAWAVLEPADD